MAVAPLDMVRQVVEYAVSEIPAKKIMLGLSNYGYVWRLPFERGVTLAASIGNQYAVTLAARHGAEIQFDNEAASPFFRYYSGGKEHVAWFEDVRSISAKFELIESLPKDGCAFFGTGGEIDKLYARCHMRKVSAGIETGNVRAYDIESGPFGSRFTLARGEEHVRCETQLLGRHNIANITLASAVASE